MLSVMAGVEVLSFALRPAAMPLAALIRVRKRKSIFGTADSVCTFLIEYFLFHHSAFNHS